MTTVTFQNGRKLTFNPIYFANELGDPKIFFHWKIYFNLSNNYADLKNSVDPIFKKTKKNIIFLL